MFFEVSLDQIRAIQIYYHYENEFLIHQFNISNFGLREWDEECKRRVIKSKIIPLVHRAKKLWVSKISYSTHERHVERELEHREKKQKKNKKWWKKWNRKEKKEQNEELKPKTWKGDLSSKGGYPSRKPERVAWMNKYNQQMRVDFGNQHEI